MIKRIAVIKWYPVDGISNAFCEELIALGYEPVLFSFYDPIPENVDMVLSFAPYDKFLPAVSQMAHFDLQKRPIFVHWNTQNQPDPKIPWMITKQIAWFRSWVDRMSDSPRSGDQFVVNLKPIQWIRQRMYRYRYVGDCQYAYSQGWLDLLVEASQVYTQWDIDHGIPAVFVPWGTCRSWYADLNLERDIDVLWFGKRRTQRRSDLLDSIRRELNSHGVKVYVIDGEEKPFIYGEERTQFLNRSKITLNLGIYPHDNVYPYRFHVVAGNRCLLVCETEMNHYPQCIPGRHYISAQADQIVEQILYYLRHEDERRRITEDAYQLVTQELTLASSLKAIIQAAENRMKRLKS